MIRRNDENALLRSGRVVLLINIILRVNTYDLILHLSSNVGFIIDLVLSRVAAFYQQPMPAHAVMGIARNNQKSNQF